MNKVITDLNSFIHIYIYIKQLQMYLQNLIIFSILPLIIIL